VSAAAVTISIKTDNGSWVNDTVDLSAVSSISAVTVAELVAAITAGAVTNLTASAESVTGYLKLALTTPGTAKYLQVKGEVALYTGMGYGYEMLIRQIDTQQSIADEPTNKEPERLEIVDSNGKVTAVISDGYRTGANITFTDTAMALDLRALLEGGLYETVAGYTNKKFTAPDSKSKKPVFTLEYFTAVYLKDDNQESNLVGYNWYKYRSCKATVGGSAGDRNMQAKTYTISATPYRDPLTNVKYPDQTIQELTVSEYSALDVLDV
jgi:hypothetical protein